MGSLITKKENEDNDDKKEEIKEDTERRKSLETEADSLQCVIAPNIFMGSAVAAKNLELLQSTGITHILAIGWNLHCHYPDKFKYLLINRIEDRPSFLIFPYFKQCFDFMDSCLNINDKNKLFVHCHKGLSRSATIIIGYEMWKHKKSFNDVSDEIKKNRSFIMPNIGFQAQLNVFERNNYSFDIDIDVIKEIQSLLPIILKKIKYYLTLYETNKFDEIDDKDLFAKTMYIHQCWKLYSKQKDKFNSNDIDIINQCKQCLYKIQCQFIKDEQSIKRFKIMFEMS